jgi:hypothetical protein
MASDTTGDDGRLGDERLLARAEAALTEIKVATGLSEPHAATLAALRIRLRGDPGSNLEELMAAADDRDGPTLDDALGQPRTRTSIEDLFTQDEKPKRSLDDLLG